MKNKGLFVTFEGGEGVGKSTLIQKLTSFFRTQGKNVVETREPGGSLLGERIRNCLLEERMKIGKMAELLLFLAARVQHVEERIKPALANGDLVLCDRFNDSTLAYQGAARGIDSATVLQLSQIVLSGFQPDLTLLLDLDPRVGLERRRGSGVKKELDRIEQEDFSFHQKVREGFLILAKQNPDRFRILDASQSIEGVYKQALQAIQDVYCAK